MYSRLYTSVLNQHYAVDFCSAFHHCYLDSGLFGISLTVHPSFVPQMAALLATQFDNVTRVTRGGIVQADLNRAKNQLKSGLAMSLESRIMQVEDLGVSPRLPSSSYLLAVLSLESQLTIPQPSATSPSTRLQSVDGRDDDSDR